MECKDESLAQQNAAEDADINNIVARYLSHGVLPQIPLPPTQEDFAEAFDFQESMNLLIAAKQSFAALPAEIRRRFGNDPKEFVAFCDDEENLPEMRKMGLAVPAPKELTDADKPATVKDIKETFSLHLGETKK